MSLRAACLFGIMASAANCRQPAPMDDAAEQLGNATVTPAVSAPPADHLAPGELVEGATQVFGVAIPRAMTVKGVFVDVAYASGPASVHALVQYFGARLEEGTLREGPSAATFEHVKVRGKPGLELLVRIATAPDGASVEVRDATPRRAPALPDEPARWRQVGLTPEGRLADPTHLD